MARVQPPNNQTSAGGVEHILCPICHRPNIPRARFCQHCGRDVVLNNDGPSYRITRVIKQGGQGAVYEVIGDDGKIYAVKEMVERALDPRALNEALARFELESNLLQRLSHPRIPRVYDHFKDEGRSYLAMDFVRGDDLEDLLNNGPVSESRVLAIADQVCDVLAYLHENGLIYRDMKPSNIMVEPDGNIKLVDFGIAEAFQQADRATQIGTPGYAPPEQYQGIARVESDIYALGATMHHMLTGRDPREEAPFSFPPVSSLAPSVSARTAEAVTRALQMQPEDRFRSAAEFRAALRPAPVPTRQIRRAPAPQPVPAARPQSVPVTRQAPVVPPVMPEPMQAAKQSKPRGGFFAAVGRFIRSLVTTVVMLVVLTVALLAAGWFFVPDIAQPLLRPYLPEIVTELLPQSALPAAPLSSDAFSSSSEQSMWAGSSSEVAGQASTGADTATTAERGAALIVIDT